MIRTLHRAVPVAIALTFVLASCGGSSDGGADEDETLDTAAVTVAEDDEVFTEVEGGDSEPAGGEETEDSAPGDTATGDAGDDPGETAATGETAPADPDEPGAAATDPTVEPTVGDDAAGSVEVSLAEWVVEAPTEYSAGDVTFTATNGGSFPHEFVVIEGEGYESLPLAEGGAVNEDDLPTGALIGRTERISGGSSEDLTVTLAPGTYVLLCNLGGGNTSHAGQGQRLDVTVT